MVQALQRNWWAVLIRGIVALLFGVLALLSPLTTGLALIILFGAYAFIDGVFAVIAAVRAAQAHERWWPLVIEGIIGLAIAGITFFNPTITAVVLSWLISAWAILTGIFEIIAAIQLRRMIAKEVFLIVSGVISMLFGIMLYAFPVLGAVTLLWIIGIYAIIFGGLLIALAFRLRNHVISP